MVSALHGVQEAKCSGTASNRTPNSEQTQFEFTQVMRALKMSYLVDTPDDYPPPSSYQQFKDQAPSEDNVIVFWFQRNSVISFMDMMAMNLQGWHSRQIVLWMFQDCWLLIVVQLLHSQYH